MALRDFWHRVRSAAALLPAGYVIDYPKLDAAAIERALRRSSGWLTPRTVAGFNEADFSFLPVAERARLAGLVAGFRAAASKVPPGATPSEALVEEALPLLRDLIGVLEFDRHRDADAFRVGKQIEQRIAAERPEELAELRFSTGEDSTGDPSIQIWAIITREPEPLEPFVRTTRAIDDLLNDTSREVEPDLWPYVGFRTVSEMAELIGAAP